MKFLVHKMGFMMQEELTGAAHFQLHKTLIIRQNITKNELTEEQKPRERETEGGMKSRN